MRERKYRAFVKQCNKMIYSENSYPKGNSDYRFVASEDHKKGLGVEYFTNRTEYVNQYGGVVLLPDWRVFTDEEAPVTEYTGLKDKNGREIYEGDVVKGIRDSHWHGGYDIVLGKVEFDEETCSFRVDGGGLLYRIEEIEIIGDVYRNPELLEAAE
ncbi:YopX family protein [Bacillus licheniformis]|uniref:YopX family protein n=1 Tax=Bacillus licheniformis TaxID=1402 RepID=UPI00237CCCC2|nr:YopX family protein [Bacillus licheniformis]MDE1367496.1 YopX family protein [Bacillus licheniformis]